MQSSVIRRLIRQKKMCALHGPGHRNRGEVQVYIDDILKATLSEYNPSLAR